MKASAKFSEDLFSILCIFMPPPRSGEGHIVLPMSVCTYVHTSVTLFSTVLVSASPPKVFDART